MRSVAWGLPNLVDLAQLTVILRHFLCVSTFNWAQKLTANGPMGNECKCCKKEDDSPRNEVTLLQAPGTAVLPWYAGHAQAEEMSEKEYNQKLLKVVLRVQRHWRVVTARKVFANKAAASYTGSTADKQTFLLHWQAKYIIANNLPANDAHWDSDDPAWIGKASMSKRHRFLIRRNLHWRWFNALVFGMMDEQERVFPMSTCAQDALTEIRLMKEAALTWVNGARASEGWSHNVGLFFHVYGHNSVNSLHLHVVDLDFTGPSFESQKFKNLPMDAVLQVLEQEAAGTSDRCETSAMSSFPAIDESIDLKQETVKASPVLNDADMYRRARMKLYELGGVRALRDQLRRQGFLKAGSPKLTTSNKPFNVFARLAYQDTVGRALYASDTTFNKITGRSEGLSPKSASSALS
eukprot:s8_g15.t1